MGAFKGCYCECGTWQIIHSCLISIQGIPTDAGPWGMQKQARHVPSSRDP